jgi:hypothetical protein
VLLPVGHVFLGHRLISNDDQVLRITLLGTLGEVEAAGDDGFPVDDDDLVVGNGVLIVNPDGDTLAGQEVCGGILFGEVFGDNYSFP